MRLAWLASVAIALGCSTALPRSTPPSPIYASAVSGVEGHWRYVPLAAEKAEHPSDEDFARSVDACEGEPGCLGERGFYRALCSDGLDNDGDGLSDHPADPGCAGPHALEEAPACDDDRDNDGDGLADWDGAGFSHPDPECLQAPSRDREWPEPSSCFGWPF